MEIGTKLIKLSWKFRIVSAILIGLLFAGGICLMDYCLGGEFQNLKSYLFLGTFFGSFFGIGFAYLNEKVGNRFSSKIGSSIIPELIQNEEIEIEGPANLFRGMEGVGGKIFLTNKKIIFKSHRINIQRGQTNIEYQNVKKIIERKTAKLINNGIRIITNDNKEYDFVVNERDLWVEKINKRIDKTQFN